MDIFIHYFYVKCFFDLIFVICSRSVTVMLLNSFKIILICNKYLIAKSMEKELQKAKNSLKSITFRQSNIRIAIMQHTTIKQ
jgi:hypothetical protein